MREVDELMRIRVVVLPIVLLVCERGVGAEELRAPRLAPEPGAGDPAADAVVARILRPAVVEAAVEVHNSPI